MHRDRKKDKGTAADESGSQRGKPSSGRPGRLRATMTRDWGLLVKDQDILDLVNSTRVDRMEDLAARFDAIASIIGTGDRGANQATGDASRETGLEQAATKGKTCATPLAGGVEKPSNTQALEKIERIAKESRARMFRKIVSAIKLGLEAGEEWSARYTARSVVAEAFANTPAYSQALDQFHAVIRVLRERSDGEAG